MSAATQDAPNATELERQALRALTHRDFARATSLFDDAARASEAVDQAQHFALQSAGLLIELGEYRAALERAVVLETAAVNSDIRSRASLLGIRALFHMGRADDALERILRLDPSDPAGLYLTARIARDVDDVRGSELVARLLERFPESLEGALASGSDWITAPFVPSRLFQQNRPVEIAEPRQAPEQAAPQSEPAASNGARGIQIGSFSSRENAVRHANRIQESGWEVQVEENGGGTFRVVLRFDAARPRSEAEQVQLQLREEGFEGFLLF